MDKKQFRTLIDKTHTALVNMTATKGEEYSRDDDQLANFKRQSAELDIDDTKILAIYLNKHLDAIKSFIKNGREFSEPIEGRIDDAILYLILLKALISDRRNQLNPSTNTPLPQGANRNSDLYRDLDRPMNKIINIRPQFELK